MIPPYLRPKASGREFLERVGDAIVPRCKVGFLKGLFQGVPCSTNKIGINTADEQFSEPAQILRELDYLIFEVVGTIAPSLH